MRNNTKLTKVIKRQHTVSLLKKSKDHIRIFLEKYGEKILFLLCLDLSIFSFIHFYQTQQILSDYDAIARLNIARKLIDSITPGMGQLGGIWLPFPQILMLPFIMNNFMWHSGIAGSIVSMAAFVIASIYLYKTAFLITKKIFASLLVWFVFVTNSNLLLLQTMAMSESFFLFSMIMTLYFLTRWTIKRDLLTLLYCGFFIILITLTRYEGYFIFIGAFITVITVSLLSYAKDHNRKKVEGLILLFGSIASFGIVLWCLYCALFYKDPFYWLHIYTGPKGQIITTIQPNAGGVTTHAKMFSDSIITYSESMLWMNGIVNTLLAIVGLVIMIASVIKNVIHKEKFTRYLPIVIGGIVLYLSLLYGYQKDLIPDIEYPRITLFSIFHKSFNYVSHSNIRYGTVMAPFIALYIGFFASKQKFLAVIAALIVAFQLFTSFSSPLFLQFQLSNAWTYSIQDGVSWFDSNYDHGSILISANRHENFMFQTGLPYKDFIYEGTREYWITSLNDPMKYATWVIYNQNVKEDAVTAYLTDNAHKQLATHYYLLYISNGLRIYRLKEPYVSFRL